MPPGVETVVRICLLAQRIITALKIIPCGGRSRGSNPWSRAKRLYSTGISVMVARVDNMILLKILPSGGTLARPEVKESGDKVV